MGDIKRIRICVVIDELGNYGAISAMRTEEEAEDIAMEEWCVIAKRYTDDPAPVLRTVWVEVDVPLPVVERGTVEREGEVTDG